jgi:uncharacterized protein (DUF2267 family)
VPIAVSVEANVLDHHLDPGEMAEVKLSLPHDIRTLFPVH